MDVIKTEMTPKERAVAYAAGEEVDRIPTNLSAGETAPPLYGYRIRDWYFSADIMVDVESHLAEDFGADNMGVGLGLRALVEALGTRLTYPDYGVSYVREPKFSSFGEVEGAELVDIDKDGRLPLIVESFERLMDAYGDVRTLGSGLAGPITTAGQLIDTEVFLRGMIKDRDGVHAHAVRYGQRGEVCPRPARAPGHRPCALRTHGLARPPQQETVPGVLQALPRSGGPSHERVPGQHDYPHLWAHT